MIYIGIDNGTTGTIGVITDDKCVIDFFLTPKKTEQSYTKKKKNISRIDHESLFNELEFYDLSNSIAIIERPLVNPGLFTATLSAVRALESTLIVLERLDVPVQYCDSKQWQRELLPQGIKGSTELKKASKDIGCRLFPQHAELIKKHKDADGLLIAEWARRNNL